MAPTDPQDREARLFDLLRQALAQVEAGQTVDVAALCRDDPELAAPIREALERQAGLAQLTRTARRDDPLTGTLLAGRYRLGERLGQGAMGVVYAADDQELRRRVAVKLFSPALAGDAIAEQRFLREAELLARLDHPHVVTVFDRGRSEQGLLFLVTELLEGASLAELADQAEPGDAAMADWPEPLRRQRPPEASSLRLAARWASELAAGLGAAHAAGVFHRDVKPSNVFVRTDHRAVLLDFGIAIGAGEATFTATATTLGTPYYMAPEQAEGTVRRAASVDVYGLCATLYHLLAGRPPYLGDARSVIGQIGRQDPEPLRRLRPDLPRDLRAIVEHGMERDPRRRYPDMAALESDLTAFLTYRPVRARPIGPLGRQWRRMRRAPAASAAIGLAVLAAVLLAVVVPLYREWRAQGTAAALRGLDASLPPLLAFEGTPEQRTRIEPAEQAGHLALLDRMLALDGSLVMPLLLRSAIKEDLGDARGSARDLELLAETHPDPYLRALADRALEVAPSPATKPGASAPAASAPSATDALPRPATLAARCAAATMLLRRREGRFAERALAVLEPVRSEPVARDLRIVALLAHGERGGGKAAFREALEEAGSLRSLHGYDTARWLAAQGTALLILARAEEAVAPLETADRLAPRRHGTLLNLGVAYRRLNRLPEAMTVLEAAREIRPSNTNTNVNLAYVLAGMNESDRALALAAELPETGDDAWRRFDLLGGLHFRRMLKAHSTGGRTAAITDAANAFAAYETAAGLPGAPGKRIAVWMEVARFVRDGDDTFDVVRLLDLLAEDPTNPQHLETMALLLPERGLDADGMAALRRLLRSLVSALAPSDALLRASQERIREAERKRTTGR